MGTMQYLVYKRKPPYIYVELIMQIQERSIINKKNASLLVQESCLLTQ